MSRNDIRRRDNGSFRKKPNIRSNKKGFSVSGRINFSKRNDGFDFDFGLDLDITDSLINFSKSPLESYINQLIPLSAFNDDD